MRKRFTKRSDILLHCFIASLFYLLYLPMMNKASTNTPILLCLHGWGGSKESFDLLREALKDKPIEIITPELPGFGNEPEPKNPLSVNDYAKWVVNYIQDTRYKIQDTGLFVLGHSHGGRIAIKIASEMKDDIKIDHLFLCAAAGIKHPKHIRRIIGLTISKTGNAILSIPGVKKLKPIMKKLMYKILRVHDYEKASEVMRKTMIQVSSEDLRPNLKEIDIETDIFWGTDDGYTPFSDAKIMEAEIKNSTLHSYKGIKHKVHKDKAKEIAEVIQLKLG